MTISLTINFRGFSWTWRPFWQGRIRKWGYPLSQYDDIYDLVNFKLDLSGWLKKSSPESRLFATERWGERIFEAGIVMISRGAQESSNISGQEVSKP